MYCHPGGVASPMAKRSNDERPVTKGEFVALLTLLGKHDRVKYRELRAQGWDEAIPPESESPN